MQQKFFVGGKSNLFPSMPMPMALQRKVVVLKKIILVKQIGIYIFMLQDENLAIEQQTSSLFSPGE